MITWLNLIFLTSSFTVNFNHSVQSMDLFFDRKELCERDFPKQFLCSEGWVFNLIYSLDTTKATDADEISAHTCMLKTMVLSIVPSITKIFGKSLISGKFPSEWKFVRVVPVLKDGEPTCPANYRLVCILPKLSKLLEKHVHSLLSHYLLT